MRLGFTGAQANVINYVNNNIINKGNVAISDVPTFNSQLGVRLAFSFRLIFPDLNCKDSTGLTPEWLLYCSNPSTSSIFISTNYKNNITNMPNLFGDGLLFIIQPA